MPGQPYPRNAQTNRAPAVSVSVLRRRRRPLKCAPFAASFDSRPFTVTMRIGSIELKNRLFAAPMAGVTDRPFRALCRRMGAGYVVGEMTSADPRFRDSVKTIRRLNHEGEPSPVAVQLVGSDPVALADAARYNVDRGAQIIDLNMGCPARKVCHVACGSALLKDEALVARIVQAVVAAVHVPVSLKFRTGWDPDHRNAVRIARLAQAAGIQMLILHGRTRACGFSGRAEYDTIASVKSSVQIPVVANGDIDSPQKAKLVFEYTGADAIMIGRAAQGRPWIFREIEHYLQTGSFAPPLAVNEVRQHLLEHLDEHYRFYGEELGVQTARKHLNWYTRCLQGGTEFRQQMNRLLRSQDQRDALEAFLRDAETKSDRLRYCAGTDTATDRANHGGESSEIEQSHTHVCRVRGDLRSGHGVDSRASPGHPGAKRGAQPGAVFC
jgi:tRNA-dihydrouridine synthase B